MHRFLADPPKPADTADRYVDPAGRVYDLTGALLGESSPLASAWWLTPGSLIGIDHGDPARTNGASAALVAVSTIDGRRPSLVGCPPCHTR